MNTQFDSSRLKFWNILQSFALTLWGMSGAIHHTLKLHNIDNPYLEIAYSTLCPSIMLAACAGINNNLYHYKPDAFSQSSDLIPVMWSISIMTCIADKHSSWKKMNGASWVAGVIGCTLMIKENSQTSETRSAMFSGTTYLAKLLIDVAIDATQHKPITSLPIIGSSAIFVSGILSTKQCFQSHYGIDTITPQSDDFERRIDFYETPSHADNGLEEIKPT